MSDLRQWYRCTCGAFTNDDSAFDDLVCGRHRPDGPLVRHVWQPLPLAPTAPPETRQDRTIRRLRALADGYRARAKRAEEGDGKYYVKARVYGAIASEFRRALHAIAEGLVNPQMVAKDVLAWRHLSSGGVPMEAVMAFGELLLGAKAERARVVARLREMADQTDQVFGEAADIIESEEP